ncbi:hypothetical protein MKS88_002394 [Plasmodium brasilianum]|uniref:Nuclease associated modular domain-containing protein n=2 Tax=Plasmodium (Plasmodium) TaxID=418103 RepID=A0A1A8VY36_PLAMA|nr:conserved Plasmodium protein, unknown function [Plasmodium malariae]KAI4838883.1 hypothetical protein MKS88_002394 [Plasmodium brasilianum]SBS84616.1 conserved Plasmodium protein, unknown function [Plasmodium malariae]SCN12226.1 conserved Plasmodium protein, unknown function [Plasmodium malariae]
MTFQKPVIPFRSFVHDIGFTKHFNSIVRRNKNCIHYQHNIKESSINCMNRNRNNISNGRNGSSRCERSNQSKQINNNKSNSLGQDHTEEKENLFSLYLDSHYHTSKKGDDYHKIGKKNYNKGKEELEADKPKDMQKIENIPNFKKEKEGKGEIERQHKKVEEHVYIQNNVECNEGKKVKGVHSKDKNGNDDHSVFADYSEIFSSTNQKKSSPTAAAEVGTTASATARKGTSTNMSELENKKPLQHAHRKEETKKKIMSKEEVRKKLSELAKLRWRDVEERKKLLRCKNTFKHSEKTKELLSYKIKLKWKDDNYRKRIIEKTRIFNQDENTKRRKSQSLKEKWKSKEFREKMLSNRKPFSTERRKKISDIIKQKWTEEEYKQKTLNAIRENYKKRKLEVGLNPNLNYTENAMMFKQLGMSAPKIRSFPNGHKEKLRGKKRTKIKKKDKENYKENWKSIYDSLLDKNEFQNSLSYLNKIDNLRVSTNT